MTANLLFGAALGYAGLVGGLYLFQDRLLYHPVKTLTTDPGEVGLPYEEVWLETEDGFRLHGWWLPQRRGAATLLFLHGNAGNISHRVPLLQRIYQLGVSVLIVDYRGYGLSEGKPSERGTYLDAEAAWRYLVEVLEIPPEEIVVYGRSLGGSIAAYLAATKPTGGVVIDSTFTSLPDLAAELYPYLPTRLLTRFRYPTVRFLERIEEPLLILHGREDALIPPHHAERLFLAADQPKELAILPGGHNDLPFVTSSYWELLARWLRSRGGGRSPPPPPPPASRDRSGPQDRPALARPDRNG